MLSWLIVTEWFPYLYEFIHKTQNACAKPWQIQSDQTTPLIHALDSIWTHPLSPFAPFVDREWARRGKAFGGLQNIT